MKILESIIDLLHRLVRTYGLSQLIYASIGVIVLLLLGAWWWMKCGKQMLASGGMLIFGICWIVLSSYLTVTISLAQGRFAYESLTSNALASFAVIVLLKIAAHVSMWGKP